LPKVPQKEFGFSPLNNGEDQSVAQTKSLRKPYDITQSERITAIARARGINNRIHWQTVDEAEQSSSVMVGQCRTVSDIPVISILLFAVFVTAGV